MGKKIKEVQVNLKGGKIDKEVIFPYQISDDVLDSTRYSDTKYMQYKKVYFDNFSEVTDGKVNEYLKTVDRIVWLDETYQQEQGYSFLKYVMCVLSEESLVLAHEYSKQGKDKEGTLIEDFAMDFLFFIAYMICRNKEYNINKMGADFKKILDANSQCQKQYIDVLKFMDRSKIVGSLPGIMVSSCPVIVSVLCHIHEVPIARKVKRILIRYHKLELKQSEEINKAHMKLIHTEDEARINEMMSDMAYMMLFNYFKDRRRIAPYSPFIFVATPILSGIYRRDIDSFSLFASNLLAQKIDDKSKLGEKVRGYFNILDDLIKDDEIRLFRLIYEDLVDVMEINGKLKNIYLNGFSIKNIICSNKLKLVHCMRKYDQESKNECFEDISPIKKQYLIGTWCTLIWLSQREEKAKMYINKDVRADMLELDYQEQLFQLEAKIKEKDEILVDYGKKNNKMKKYYEDRNEQNIHRIQTLNKKENHHLMNELTKKEEQIKSLQENQQELYKLRELMFSLHEDKEIIQERKIGLNEILETKTILFVGGHIGFHNKLKQTFPKLTLLHVDAENFHHSIVKNADFVFMYARYISHGMYYRIIKITSKHNVRWDYVHHNNLEMLEDEMIEKLQKHQDFL